MSRQSQANLFGAVAAARRVEAALAGIALSPQECALYVARRVGEARLARARSGWFGGRFWNRVSGVDAENVTISGAVVLDFLTAASAPVPDNLSRGEDIVLPFDVAEELAAEARRFLEDRGS